MIIELPTMDDIEKQVICARLEIFDNNMSETAESLKIGRTTLYRKIDKFNIKVERK